MTDFSKLSRQEVIQALRETREALRRGRDLLDFVAREKTTLGVQKMADATPSQMEKLEAELWDLEAELEKKNGG